MTLGGAVLAVAFLVTTVLLPTWSRWRDREALIDALQHQRAQLVALVAQAPSLEAMLHEREAGAAALPVRLVRGRTPALASATLQSVLQQYAAESQVSISRLDVASTPPDSAGMSLVLPATIAAIGDIYALVDFLSRLEYGSPLLEVTELVVHPNPSLRGELLQLSLTLHAPYLVEP